MDSNIPKINLNTLFSDTENNLASHISFERAVNGLIVKFHVDMYMKDPNASPNFYKDTMFVFTGTPEEIHAKLDEELGLGSFFEI